MPVLVASGHQQTQLMAVIKAVFFLSILICTQKNYNPPHKINTKNH